MMVDKVYEGSEAGVVRSVNGGGPRVPHVQCPLHTCEQTLTCWLEQRCAVVGMRTLLGDDVPQAGAFVGRLQGRKHLVQRLGLALAYDSCQPCRAALHELDLQARESQARKKQGMCGILAHLGVRPVGCGGAGH